MRKDDFGIWVEAQLELRDEYEKWIYERIQQNMINNQREFYLREQMRTISQELGEDMEDGELAYELKDKIKALPLEDAYKEKLL